MDVVLEFFDRFVFDRFYSAVLPAPPEVLALAGIGQNATSLPLGASAPYDYQYVPATKYISFGTTEHTYMSRWPRDFSGRQALSLYLITW